MPNMGMIMPVLGAKASSSRSPRRKSLADALFTKTQQRVLRVFFAQPARSAYASELIREAGTGSGAAQRELAKLESSWPDLWGDGSAIKSTIRRIRLAAVLGTDKHCSQDHRAKGSNLRASLQPLSSAIHAAFVFGSVAKAFDHSASDIDLMIISDSLTYGDLFGALERVTNTLGRKVNPTVYTSTEFSKRARSKNAFVTRVLEQPKLWVIGSEDDIHDAA